MLLVPQERSAETRSFMRNIAQHLGTSWTPRELYVHLRSRCRTCVHEVGHFTHSEAVDFDVETCGDIPGTDDALVGAPDISEERWADVNRKFCELFADKKS